MRLIQRVMTGTCALVLGGAGFSSAGYATGTTVYGAGSSLVAPYAREEFDCFGHDANLYFQNATPANAPTVTNPLSFTYNGTQCTSLNEITGNGAPPVAAPIDSTSTLNYESTGSGTGIKAIFRHDATAIGALPSTWPSAPLGVQYALAETSLDATDVSIWNSGNDSAYNSGTNVCSSSGTEHVGLCIAGPGETPGGSNQYANPAQSYGALIQIPMLVTPVAIAFDPVYAKVLNADNSVTEYKFNLRFPRANGSGGLRLDQATFCKIFNGQITNWNDPAIKALNGNKSLEDPNDPTPAQHWSVTLQIVGRSDSSGTTSLFTRHAAAICPSVSYTSPTVNNYTSVTTTLPSAILGPTYNKNQGPNVAPAGETPGKFTVANGSDGVAQYVGFTQTPTTVGVAMLQGRIGYVGPDYALPYVNNTHATPSVLMTATLKNHAGTWEIPTPGTAAVAFGSQLPPQTSNASTGYYDASATSTGLRSNPQDWVQGTTTSSYLADPTPATAYPIVGTSNMIFYTCYKSGYSLNTMVGFLKWYGTAAEINGATTGLLQEAGFSAVPTVWRKAIQNTFITPSAAAGTSSLNLEPDAAGFGVCSSKVGG